MNKNSPAPVVQQSAINLENPVIAVTAILVIGLCYCVTIHANAKYNRNTEITCGSLRVSCVPSVSVTQ